jgi:hypothetical protein
MFRLTQIIRNFFLRIEGAFSIVWRSFANLIKGIFGFFGQLFGLTETGYFIESDQAQTTKQIETQQQIESQQQTVSENPAVKRRRANAKMDYYLNMARDLKKG